MRGECKDCRIVDTGDLKVFYDGIKYETKGKLCAAMLTIACVL